MRNIAREGAKRCRTNTEDNKHLAKEQEEITNTKETQMQFCFDEIYLYLSSTTTLTMFLINRLKADLAEEQKLVLYNKKKPCNEYIEKYDATLIAHIMKALWLIKRMNLSRHHRQHLQQQRRNL